LYLPKFSDADATKFFAEHGEIVSVNCAVGPDDTFVLALPTRLWVFGPMTSNRTAAEALCR